MTSEPAESAQGNLLDDLDAEDSTQVREGLEEAGRWLRSGQADDELSAALAGRLLRLASHPKREVRKAVIRVVLDLRHQLFYTVIARMVEDEEAWARDAARKTMLSQGAQAHLDSDVERRTEEMHNPATTAEERYGMHVYRAASEIADCLNDQFVREAQHEIVRIVSPIDASLMNLEYQLAALQVPADALDQVRRARERVALVPNFFDNLRVYTTELPSSFTTEELHSVLSEAASIGLDSFRQYLPRITIAMSANRALKLDADRSRLLQALINIIANAVEACFRAEPRDQRSKVSISATAEGETHVRITIDDNGCGMNEEARRDCVLLYSSGKPGGMGFGLPLAKKIIEVDHRGMLSIESQLGIGTMVSLVLPVKRAAGK